MRRVRLRSEQITLGAFLKWIGAVPTGGQAKALLQKGLVKVNGEAETRRAHVLRGGDEVDVPGLGSFRLEVGPD